MLGTNQPTSLVHWKVAAAYWAPNFDNITITVGVGPVGAPLWSKVLMTEVPREALTIDMWADVTEAQAWLPPDWTNRWWISVTDHYAWDIASVQIFDVESQGLSYSGSTPLPFDTSIDEGTFYAYVPCGPAAIQNYYINNDSRAGDMYCTAPGDGANDGLTPATPKRTLDSLLERYTLQAGNTVWIDTGRYQLTHPVTIDYLDTGNGEQSLRFTGPPTPGKAIFEAPTSFPAFNLFYSRNVTLENLEIVGGTDGIYSKEPRMHTFRNLVVTSCTQSGIELHGEYYEGYYEPNFIEHSVVSALGNNCVLVELCTLSGAHCVIHSPNGKTCLDVKELSVANVMNSILYSIGGLCFAGDGLFHSKFNDLYAPGGSADNSGEGDISWQVSGNAWGGKDTVRLEYSPDDGANWASIDDAGRLAYNAGEFSWDVRRLPSGAQYRFRIVSNEDPAIAVEAGPFTITPLIGHNYFVNDSDQTNDVYCVAVGTDTNDGLTSATPKTSVQAIIGTYDLEGGDTVFIDTGYYLLDSDIVLTQEDTGAYQSDSGTQYVIFKGSTRPGGTILNRGDQSPETSCIKVADGWFCRFENLTLTGAYDGFQIYSYKESIVPSDIHEVISHCVIRGNSRYGIYLPDGADVFAGHFISVDHSLIVNNGQGGICVPNDFMGYPNLWLDNCTISAGNHTAIQADGVRVNNSIFAVEGVNGRCLRGSDYHGNYNDFFTSGSAIIFESVNTLAAWQARTGQDQNSITVNPLFAKGSADFHLQSTGGRWNSLANGGTGDWEMDAQSSLCIDAGDPAAPLGAEPEENGDRVNIGAYGGTAEASKSPAGRQIKLNAPIASQIFRGSTPVIWLASGSAYASTDTLRLELSSDDGRSWRPVPNAAHLPYQQGRWGWDTSLHPDTTAARLRLICNQDTSTSDTTERFYIHNHGLAYFVNDASTVGDMYCAAPGNDANDGLTSATAKATVKSLLDAYDLEPGDRVYVDAGLYHLGANVILGAAASGDATGYVRLQGVAGRTVLDRGSSAGGACCLEIHGNYLWIDGFVCQGANTGLSVNLDTCKRATITDNIIRDNSGPGLEIKSYNSGDGEQYLIRNNLLYNNASGMSLSNGDFEYRASFDVISNTVLNLGNGITCQGGTCTLRNNIVRASGSGNYCLSDSYSFFASSYSIVRSDYNDLFITAGAFVAQRAGSDTTLREWASGTGFDAHSLSVDPLFADPRGATSTCVRRAAAGTRPRKAW